MTVDLSCELEANLVSVERNKSCCEILEQEAAGATATAGGVASATVSPVKLGDVEAAIGGAGAPAAAVAAIIAPAGTAVADSAWPAAGKIEFRGVSVAYRDGPLVLKTVSFELGKHEKVGVVGRTGSGKSTVFLALFRALDPRAGSIFIDGVDISAVALATLRSNLGIIPQDPMLFTGTVRFNIDPLEQYTDAQLWDALAQVDLRPHIKLLPGGLLHPVDEGGSNFSTGQRQLLCIARAVLRKSKVLVMDEATASIDVDTDRHIQKMIRTNFAECTCLTIAHRLNTVMDSDRILVLDHGSVAEFGQPAELLAHEGGALLAMVEATGEEHAKSLRSIAAAAAAAAKAAKAASSSSSAAAAKARAKAPSCEN
jgi:ABC-type multidrug transport system fused ATPase/permease subunit